MNPVLRLVAAGAAILAVGGTAAQQAAAQPEPELPYRVLMPFVARDPFPAGDIPPPDPAYCPPLNPASSPPNSVIGLLSIGGAPAPAGTLVQVYFDGLAGPGIRTRETGGYAIHYHTGGASCSNSAGAEISVVVNGQPYATGMRIGDAAANPYFRFDVPPTQP